MRRLRAIRLTPIGRRFANPPPPRPSTLHPCSIFKAARYYRMDAKSIPTLPMGEIDYDALEKEVRVEKSQKVITKVNS